MIVTGKFDLEDNIDWVIEHCEVGSSIRLVTKDGNDIVRISSIPSSKLLLLRERLDEELSKPIMIDPITKKRKREHDIKLESLCH